MSARPEISALCLCLRGVLGTLALVAFCCLESAPVWSNSKAGDRPIYNPASKSYFQLVNGTGRHGNWPEARRQALTLSFRGVRGRLAVVDSAKTHEFVMRNFNVSKEMWVGLRFWCQFRMLEWSGQRPYVPTDPGHFHVWHPQWSRGNLDCPPGSKGPDAYMGVYYRPVGTQSARWQAARIGKGFNLLLVEFPTGEE